MLIQITTSSEEETEQLAARLASRLGGGDIITLEGPLGAGKTCFVRGIARGLRLNTREVSSPTFTITQEYTSETGPSLVHIDAYRLHGVDDLESIGWEELVSAPSIIIAVEWPSRIAAAMHDLPRIDVSLEPTSQHCRQITITARNELATRLESFHD